MYKKIASLSVLILTTLFFIGCSKDSADSSTKNEERFLNLNLNGTELNYNYDFWGSSFVDQENCANNGKLVLNFVGQIENSSYFVDGNLAHFENLVDFSDTKKNIATTTRVTDTNSIWWIWSTDDINNSFCNLNNDLSLVIKDKTKDNVYLKLKPNTTSKHNITKTEFLSEDSTSKTYAIEGNFSATYIKDKSDFPVSGNYRTLIEVLK